MRLLARLLVGTAAIALLVTAGTPEVRELVRRLDSPSADERDAAARGLRELGEDARDVLERVIVDGSAETQRRARSLLALLDDDDGAARRREARALVRQATRTGGDAALRSRAETRLAELGTVAAEAVAEEARRRAAMSWLDEETALRVAGHPSADGVDVLADALRRHRVLGSAVVRVARALAEPGHEELLTDDARQALQIVLAVPGDPRRRGAAALLLAFRPEEAPRHAGDPDAGVRVEAAHALARLRGAGAQTLRRLAGDGETRVRVAALTALGQVPGRPTPGPAEENARDPEPRVRAAAAALLGRDALPTSLPVLARLATDESARVRAAAERSLAALGSR